jgi:hypothetical protein
MLAKTSYEKGRHAGRDEASLDILRRILPIRFGAVAGSVWRKIEAMSIEQREQIAVDFVKATSLEQLGLVAGEPDPIPEHVVMADKLS